MIIFPPRFCIGSCEDKEGRSTISIGVASCQTLLLFLLLLVVLLSISALCSVFRWTHGNGEASIEGVDEATIGLLDEHRLSLEDLGRRYCTSLNPDRPENSLGMDNERATQVKTNKSYYK